jgi:hypothetical protein
MDWAKQSRRPLAFTGVERRRAAELGGRNPSGRFAPFPTGGGSSVKPCAQVRSGHGIGVDGGVLGEDAREGLLTVAFEIAVRVFKRANDQGRPTTKRTRAVV